MDCSEQDKQRGNWVLRKTSCRHHSQGGNRCSPRWEADVKPLIRATRLQVAATPRFCHAILHGQTGAFDRQTEEANYSAQGPAHPQDYRISCEDSSKATQWLWEIMIPAKQRGNENKTSQVTTKITELYMHWPLRTCYWVGDNGTHVIPALMRFSQDCEFKASLGYGLSSLKKLTGLGK